MLWLADGNIQSKDWFGFRWKALSPVPNGKFTFALWLNSLSSHFDSPKLRGLRMEQSAYSVCPRNKYLVVVVRFATLNQSLSPVLVQSFPVDHLVWKRKWPPGQLQEAPSEIWQRSCWSAGFVVFCILSIAFSKKISHEFYQCLFLTRDSLKSLEVLSISKFCFCLP